MKQATWRSVLAGCALLFAADGLCAQDWPQWRGANRDGKAAGFKAPKEWPKELKQQWKVTVGDGVATPALVGDRLYVFARQGGSEVVRCLSTADGKEIWQDKYETQGATGAAAGFPGPRCSPAVAEGKVVTLGVRGVLSCYDAESGKKLWRKDNTGGTPMFQTSSSPLIVDGLCIAQIGGQNGALVAYDLAKGEEKWKWAGESTAYASPVLLTIGKTKMIVAETNQNVAGVNAADGKLLWKTPFPLGAMRSYNASTPMVDGQTVIFSGSGRGTKAVKIEAKGDEFTVKEVWKNPDYSVIYNTPVLKDGKVFGLTSSNSLFCLNAADGKKAWSSEFGGGGRRGGYGSIVDAGSVLFALTPAAELVVYEPSDKEFKQLAKYKVGSDTYAYPIVSGNRVFVKDKDSVTLWTIE